jgi:hypothetical protein
MVMDNCNSKVRGRQGLRVSPHCRGAASSVLRLSHQATSGFGALGRATTLSVRLGPAGAASVTHTEPRDLEVPRAPAGAPLFTRLWPTAAPLHPALWQDTLVAVD